MASLRKNVKLEDIQEVTNRIQKKGGFKLEVIYEGGLYTNAIPVVDFVIKGGVVYLITPNLPML